MAGVRESSRVTDAVGYTTRERIQATLEQADSVRNNRRIDECVQAGSRDVEGLCHRLFYPTSATRYPDPRWVSGDTLWVNDRDHEILALTGLLVDGTALTAGTHYYLDYATPPYVAVRLLRDSTAAWSVDQRSIVMVGQFGASADTAAAGALAGSLNGTATQVSVTDSSLVGVGDLVTIDSERVLVTEKLLIDTGVTVGAAGVASSTSATLVPVSSGAGIKTGELIMIGAERMFVEQVAGNNLVVKRAANASTLAPHVSTDIVYAPRSITIVRGATGTTAASHLTAAPLLRNNPPGLVQELATAYALNYLEQGGAAYARVVGSGDNARQATGGGVQSIEADTYTAYGRKGRIGV